MALPVLYIEQQTEPFVGTEGATVLWFDTSTLTLKRYNGTAWVPVAGVAVPLTLDFFGEGNPFESEDFVTPKESPFSFDNSVLMGRNTAWQT